MTSKHINHALLNNSRKKKFRNQISNKVYFPFKLEVSFKNDLQQKTGKDDLGAVNNDSIVPGIRLIFVYVSTTPR